MKAVSFHPRFRMRISLMIEPQQGLSYDEQLQIARLAERSGFETLYRSDHYTSFPGASGRPTTDAWSVLAGLARETSTIRLGALVSPVTFRHPGSFAKVVTTVDEMSGGRVDVGVGAGWNDTEHRELGLAFPPVTERADLMEDELAILHGLWDEPDGWKFEGHQIRLESGSFRPRPVQKPHPPIIIGGTGSPRSLRLAARYADEYNMSSSSADECRDAYARLDDECRKTGRDPKSIRKSAMVGMLMAANESELQKRVAAQIEMVQATGADAEGWFETRRSRWIAGTPDEARAMVRRFAEAGAERLMLQDMLPRDYAMIELAAAELIGKV
jgi:F420-dependent oxidoreductase-like protein